ncbi:MAPEG family protein [Dyella nitratireducens]|uniref:Membrane protein n=1 Tax=Dyella nitratireducens TaxID=1849580 RepID=A0ABQ1FSK7_9GAMM|nr:MAPEG family protein [Dyella nitratireducens]GGA29410.1 membrane protein [Dyella nitratireducens]GLQ43143.1 membrane protein [Dyella nitratireducens]
MKLTPELYFLALVATATVLMWIPYITARMFTRGAWQTLANPADPMYPPDPAWAERAQRAHANAVENLAVFAPLVIILAMLDASTPATILASKIYLGTRLVHYLVYAAGIPVVRTLSFLVGVGSTLVIAAAVLSHA